MTSLTETADAVTNAREFTVWAPRAEQVGLWVDGVVHAMRQRADGWWTAATQAPAGCAYGFLLDDGDAVLPDPASRRQPQGVHQPSCVYEQDAFSWTDSQWTGRALPGAVIYELHIGTFTPEGTFAGATHRISHLVALGVTHVELMPVNAFTGRWNWGYDGVGWYAVQEAYGGPDGLKAFVDACHIHGLAVILDVVYNHLGPSGNYLAAFGPYFKEDANNWGELINLDGAGCGPVRRFIIENALMWLSDFHLDGLRLDAVHALEDSSVPHLLEVLTSEVDALSAHIGRPLTLIAESNLNDTIMVRPAEAHGYGMHAQWDDDFHHAVHALVTGERQGYYCDFGPLAVLVKVLTAAFFHDGTYSSFLDRMHGRPVDRHVVPGYRFVVCIQNHDQVGNRAAGERLTELAPGELQRIAAVLLFSSPFTPMIWMGEEWAASTRWPFFTDHGEPQLARQAAEHRADEFAQHGWDIAEMVDPQEPRAFGDAVLDWAEVERPEHSQMLTLYRDLIALRRAEPDLADPRLALVNVEFDEDHQWLIIHRGGIRVVANLAQTPLELAAAVSDVLLTTGETFINDGRIRLAGRTAAIVRRAATERKHLSRDEVVAAVEGGPRLSSQTVEA